MLVKRYDTTFRPNVLRRTNRRSLLEAPMLGNLQTDRAKNIGNSARTNVQRFTDPEIVWSKRMLDKNTSIVRMLHISSGKTATALKAKAIPVDSDHIVLIKFPNSFCCFLINNKHTLVA